MGREEVSRDSLRGRGIKWTDGMDLDCDGCGGTVIVSGYPKTESFDDQPVCGALGCKQKPTHWEHIGDGDHIGWCAEHRESGLTMAEEEPTAWIAYEDDDCYCRDCGAVGVVMVDDSIAYACTEDATRFVREEDR